MPAKKITLEDLAGMIKKGFDENTEQHQKIFKVLNNHTERLGRIETKLEGIVYRKEFEELRARVEVIEDALVIKKKS